MNSPDKIVRSLEEHCICEGYDFRVHGELGNIGQIDIGKRRQSAKGFSAAFWLAHSRKWHLGELSYRVFELPEPLPTSEFCDAILNAEESSVANISPVLVSQFGLKEISYFKFQRRFCNWFAPNRLQELERWVNRFRSAVGRFPNEVEELQKEQMWFRTPIPREWTISIHTLRDTWAATLVDSVSNEKWERMESGLICKTTE